MYPYGSEEPLQLLGSFSTDVSVKGNDQPLKEEFYVISGKGPALLGKDTAVNLGVLKLGVHRVSDELLSEFKDCFTGLGELKDYELDLHIDKEIQPVAQKMHRVPFSLRDKVGKKLDELEALDVIEKVEGPTPWVSPVVCVPKSNGDIRLCVDMREANRAIIRERHPIPTIDDLLNDMNNSSVFSKIDLNMGFHQIRLSEKSREITTFITPKGLYRYKRLSFGISSAPEKYQHIISQVLQDCEGVANIADDIIVHGSNQQEHDERLRKCLNRLKEKGLTINSDKTEFNMAKVTFMGHVLSKNGIGPTAERVKAVVNAKEPQNASEVKSFLGLVNFSARYIKDISSISEPLRRLTRKDQLFVWGKEQQESFKELKNRLSNAETLGYFNPNAKTKVITDASSVGLGAVLIQEVNGDDKVISYASRTLSDVEKRYSTTEKEALAIVWACERFHLYLYGMNFDLITDHKPLEVIYSTKSKPSARIQRWVLRLQSYTFTVKYRSGRENIADALSRLTENSQNHSDFVDNEEYVRYVALNATPNAMSTREVEEISADDEEISDLRDCVNSDKWDKSMRNFLPMRYEFCSVGKLVLRGTRIVIPKGLRKRCIELAHEGHLGIVGTKQRLRAKVWWPAIDRDVEKYVRSCYGCQLVSRQSRPEPLKPSDLPAGPWQDVAIDLMGPLPSGDYVFVCVDYYSRYYEIDILKSTTTERIIDSLEKMFLTHGLPLSITSDNGPQFISSVFGEYLKNNEIKHRRVTPLSPSVNGEVERQNQSLLKRLKIAQAEGKNWRNALSTYLMAYRTTPHSVTGATPSEMLMGRKIRTKLPEIQFSLNDEEVRDRDMIMKEKSKSYTDEHRKAEESTLKPGDKVLLKQDRENKLSTRFEHEPYTVVHKQGTQVHVESADKITKIRNSTHVKKFIEPEIELSTDYDTTEEIMSEQSADSEVHDQTTESAPALRRSSRVVTRPKKLDDFVVGTIT